MPRRAHLLAAGEKYRRVSVGPTGPSFPRLAGMLIGSPHNYDEAPYQADIAQLDLAILGMYNGWNDSGHAAAVTAIKALNPDILLGNYTIMTEMESDPSNVTTADAHTKLSAEAGPGGIGDWWAYDATGAHTDWASGDFSSWDTNLTLLTTPDTNGDRWPQWAAKRDFAQIIDGIDWDFWYCDNNFWKPRSDADWDRNGTNNSRDDIATRNLWRDGQRAHYDQIRTLAPTLAIMVNADSDLGIDAFPNDQDADAFTQYVDFLDGAFLEHAMGVDWSAETWGGWDLALAWYHATKANLIGEAAVLFDIAMEANPADYQFLRYGFASALMDDGYFSVSTDYNQVLWFDEFDLAGTATTKWLGQAIDTPRTSPWQSGVYRRNFTGGTVLVNPKGNGPQTVTLEVGYNRFTGTQAPTVNDGSPATSVTLADRDGLFLITA